MPCYHPLRAFKVGINKKTGNDKYIIKAYDELSVFYDDKLYTSESSILIPCGQCLGCRLKRSKEWAVRLMLELMYHEDAYFLTLTYDDKHLPINDWISPDGEPGQSPIHTLVKRDMQLFFKRVRKNSGQTIRVFYCGEYGSKTFRPHYHAIVFGLKLDDLKIYKRNFEGDILYNSPFLDKCWKKGFLVVADVTYESAAYVARYVTKKLTGNAGKEFYDRYNIVPPFLAMSNRPGIAYQYFEDHKDDIYKFDMINISTKLRGITVKPPKYFDKKYEVDYPSDMEMIKANRSIFADYAKRLKENETGLDWLDILSIEKDNLLHKLGKILERDGI